MKLLLVSASLGVAAALGANPCTLDPCARGTCGKATARYNLASYECTCPVGWSGVNCEIQSLVAPCFSSNMVLQSGSHKTSIYGDANATTAGDTVTVTVSPVSAVTGRSRRFTATADADGRWSVTLGEIETSSKPMTIDIGSKSGTKQTLRNVLAGLVYVCSGQSNMALPVSSGYLPLDPGLVEAQAAKSPHIRLLNNGHFWPPTPSHPGGTALGKQRGDAPGWQLPSYGNGSFTSQGTVANFSAVCWFMGATISAFYDQKTPVGLISTDAGGTSIHRWVSQKAAAKCSQITPTSVQSMGADIGTLCPGPPGGVSAP
jgi:sialate O-acetylesterase